MKFIEKKIVWKSSKLMHFELKALDSWKLFCFCVSTSSKRFIYKRNDSHGTSNAPIANGIYVWVAYMIQHFGWRWTGQLYTHIMIPIQDRYCYEVGINNPASSAAAVTVAADFMYFIRSSFAFNTSPTS